MRTNLNDEEFHEVVFGAVDVTEAKRRVAGRAQPVTLKDLADALTLDDEDSDRKDHEELERHARLLEGLVVRQRQALARWDNHRAEQIAMTAHILDLTRLLGRCRIHICQNTLPTVAEAWSGSIVDDIDRVLVGQGTSPTLEWNTMIAAQRAAATEQALRSSGTR